MLLELRAENYAVIDHAVAEFGLGLNLLTGETGAGKSILIDALALLLGGKASSDVVRHGAEKAVVGCVFESTPGAEADSGGQRDRSGGGRDSAAARDWRERQGQSVREQSAGDGGGAAAAGAGAGAGACAGGDAGVVRSGAAEAVCWTGLADLSTDEVAAAFAAWRAATERIEELQAAEQDRLRMAGSVELSGARRSSRRGLSTAEEDARLEAEKRVLANAEKLFTAAMRR